MTDTTGPLSWCPACGTVMLGEAAECLGCETPAAASTDLDEEDR